MGSVQKIKKQKQGSMWSRLSRWERVAVCIPVVVAVALFAYIVIAAPSQGSNYNAKDRASKELLLSTSGSWTGVGDMGFDVWLPTHLPVEKVKGHEKDQILAVRRDKGGLAEELAV